MNSKEIRNSWFAIPLYLFKTNTLCVWDRVFRYTVSDPDRLIVQIKVSTIAKSI